MRLTRADRQLLDVCREALNRRYGHIAEVGSRKAEIASTLMREYPKLLVHLCGVWNNCSDMSWVVQSKLQSDYDAAMKRTEYVPARRQMHRGDPADTVSRIGQYSLSVCCFSDTRYQEEWDDWYSKVQSSGVMCGVRSPSADDSLAEWSKYRSVPLLFGQRIWWVSKAR